MPNHRVRGLPASLFLDDDTFALYCIWQNERNVETSTAGCVYSAFEHHNFRTSLRVCSEVTSSVPQDTEWPKPGDVCDHLFHPAQSLVSKTCPICCVQICLDFLEVVRVAWMKHENNPDRHVPRQNCARKRKSEYIALWTRARIEMEILKTSLGDMVAVEASWEREHPEEDVKEAYSATKALHKASAEVMYPGRITAEPEIKASEVKPKSTKPKKKVSFTTGTKFDTGRAKLFWNRRSPRYKPGLNACPSPEGWLDRSNYTIPRFNASQCKLYVIKSLEQYRSIQKDLRILATLKHEGQVSLHRLWDEIQGENEGRMVTMEKKQGDSFYSSSNTIVVLETATGKVSKRMFVTVPNPENTQEALRDEDWKSCNGTIWTSLKKIQG